MLLELPKDQVLEFIRERAGADEVARAEEDLPERIDTRKHADLLATFGVNPIEVLSQFNGNVSTRFGPSEA